MHLRQLSSRQSAQDLLPLKLLALQRFKIPRLFFWASAILFVLGFLSLPSAEAGFAGRFSLSLQEEYNDNIFFDKKKDSDFITFLSPTLSLLYAPFGQTRPVFRADFTPVGQLFADHSKQTNFGDNVALKTEYIHYYSPRLTLYASDVLQRLGETRTGEFGLQPGRILPPTTLPTVGGAVAQRSADLVSSGKEFHNDFGVRGEYSFSETINLVADYAFGYTSYLDQGGNTTSQQIGARGVYKWRDEHNLHFGYNIGIIKSRNGDDNIVHTLDFGDDFFSSFKIQLDPTLTVSASSGISINGGVEGPRIANNTNVSVVKLWEASSLSLGIKKGLTPSLGVAGISNTTSFFSNFDTRLTELLTGLVALEYSLYDAKDAKFNTFVATAGLQYRVTSWLSSNLRYAHRWTDSSAGTTSTGLLGRGRVDSNSVSIALTTNFDLWPNLGLSRATLAP